MSADVAPKVDLTFTEMTESLTGFDEIAVEKHMGIDPYSDGERKPIKAVRALVFVHLTRQGKNAPQAVEEAQSMPMKDVMSYFAEEPDEVFEDEPVTAMGEGDGSAE